MTRPQTLREQQTASLIELSARLSNHAKDIEALSEEGLKFLAVGDEKQLANTLDLLKFAATEIRSTRDSIEAFPTTTKVSANA